MMPHLASLLGALYGASEIGLSIFKRAKVSDAQQADRGSLLWLWAVIVVNVVLAFNAPFWFPHLNLGAGALPALYIGVALYAGGLCLRWYSILVLGRFFTVNVAIAADHKLVDSGPYRHVRHPSYTGALLAFFGLGLCIGNGISILLLLIPIFIVFKRRMQVEEAALLQGLGEPYREYMRRTKRLVPALY